MASLVIQACSLKPGFPLTLNHFIQGMSIPSILIKNPDMLWCSEHIVLYTNLSFLRTFLRNSGGMPRGSLATACIASLHCWNASSPGRGSMLNRIRLSIPARTNNATLKHLRLHNYTEWHTDAWVPIQNNFILPWNFQFWQNQHKEISALQ